MPPQGLTGPEILELRDAILSSIASPNELNELVLYALSQPIDNFIDPGPLKFRITDLIQFTEAQGRTAELVAAAVQRAPRNEVLRRQADKLHVDEGAGNFERIVRARLGFLDTTAFLNGLIASMNAVCRVELDGEGIGTGFLVGPSRVITNHHVIFEDGVAAAPDHLTFHFDYKKVDNRVINGVVFTPDANEMILADSAVNDFTLLKLSQAAGNGTIGDLSNAPKRGWLKPQGRVLQDQDPLMIIQHPNALSQKFALGTVTVAAGTPANRVRYDVNTDEGSSGSPCFAQDWTPVALHHWGGADHNRGVLFSAILADLQTKNVSLGA